MTRNDAIPAHSRTHVWLHPAAIVLSKLGRLVKAIKDRRGAARLYRLSDGDLKDIGVTRNDVDREVMKPVTWR